MSTRRLQSTQTERFFALFDTSRVCDDFLETTTDVAQRRR